MAVKYCEYKDSAIIILSSITKEILSDKLSVGPVVIVVKEVTVVTAVTVATELTAVIISIVVTVTVFFCFKPLFKRPIVATRALL